LKRLTRANRSHPAGESRELRPEQDTPYGILPKGKAERIGKQRSNAPHQLGADGKEMSAILPKELAEIDESQVDFVHQGGGLKNMHGPLLPHVASGGQALLVKRQG